MNVLNAVSVPSFLAVRGHWPKAYVQEREREVSEPDAVTEHITE